MFLAHANCIKQQGVWCKFYAIFKDILLST